MKKKVIIIERSKFAQLVRNYKKALVMSAVLEHICRERKSAITLTTAEICELIQLDMVEVAKNTQRGRIRCDTVKGVRYYEIMDLINLKDLLDSQVIFRQTMDQAIPNTDTAIKILN